MDQMVQIIQPTNRKARLPEWRTLGVCAIKPAELGVELIGLYTPRNNWELRAAVVMWGVAVGSPSSNRPGRRNCLHHQQQQVVAAVAGQNTSVCFKNFLTVKSSNI